MLIKCPECGKDISDQASSCPHCGYPIKEARYIVEKYNDEDIRLFITEAHYYNRCYRASGIIGGLMLVIGALLTVIMFALKILPVAILASIATGLGLVILIVGLSVNGTKYNNRANIINDYERSHPDFKEEEEENV